MQRSSTTTANILGQVYYSGLPFNRNYDLSRYERYLRYKPDIKVKYVSYYHKSLNPDLDARYPDLNDEERMKAQYGSRVIGNYVGRGFCLITKDLWFRHSLLNQGFDTREINLDREDIADDITVLVISDLRGSLSEVAMARVKEYIDRGGNMIILGEYGRSEFMNRLTAPLGVRFSDGVIACSNELTSPVVLRATYTKEAVSRHPIFAQMSDWGYGVSVPTALALDYSQVKDFEVYPYP